MGVAAVEIAEEHQEMINRGMYLRGRMITHFAQCEYLLADLSVKVDQRFIYLLKKRVKAVEKITAESGPYARYADEIVPLSNRLLAWDDLRNFLAHGMVFLVFVQKDRKLLFEFRRYCRLDDKQFQHFNWFISLTELEEASDALAAHCNKFMPAFRRIYLEENLEGQFPEVFE